MKAIYYNSWEITHGLLDYYVISQWLSCGVKCKMDDMSPTIYCKWDVKAELTHSFSNSSTLSSLLPHYSNSEGKNIDKLFCLVFAFKIESPVPVAFWVWKDSQVIFKSKELSYTASGRATPYILLDHNTDINIYLIDCRHWKYDEMCLIWQ